MKTIIVADALMGVDNVGVAGAAKGSFDLVVLGLLISVPIVVWGSTWCSSWSSASRSSPTPAPACWPTPPAT